MNEIRLRQTLPQPFQIAKIVIPRPTRRSVVGIRSCLDVGIETYGDGGYGLPRRAYALLAMTRFFHTLQ